MSRGSGQPAVVVDVRIAPRHVVYIDGVARGEGEFVEVSWEDFEALAAAGSLGSFYDDDDRR